MLPPLPSLVPYAYVEKQILAAESEELKQKLFTDFLVGSTKGCGLRLFSFTFYCMNPRASLVYCGG